MYKDIISYELAENCTIDKLTSVAKRVVENWMKNQEGFIKWEIHSNNDNGYSDIVYWATKEAAEKAEQDMGNIPNAGDWFACYKEGTISSKKFTVIAAI